MSDIPYKHTCPHCGAKHGAVSVVNRDEPHMPEPGSFGICFDCGGVFEFAEGWNTVVSVDEAEWPSELVEARNQILEWHIRQPSAGRRKEKIQDVVRNIIEKTKDLMEDTDEHTED